MNTLIQFQSIFFFCITVIQLITCVNSELAENETDRVALQAFKSKIILDPQGVLNSWNDSRHFCDWEGITCGRRHRRVTFLELRSRGLSGSLSPSIGNLSFLQKFDVSNNSLQGEIPPEVGRLFRLKDLQLRNNSLVGEIPANMSHCSRLTFLNLGINNLVGKFPSEFVSLRNLKRLSVFSNSLTGGIPHFIGNLSSLEILDLAVNAFGGNIPDSLGRLKNLTGLGLGQNNLSGTIPPSIYNLSFLVNFSLPFNQFHGSLPPNLGLALPRLKFFHISYNLFSGSIPVSLSNASELEHIHLNNNDFSGKLSIDFGGLQHLAFLHVGTNKLGSGEGDEMSFLSSLVNCSNLRVIMLLQNQFRGPLPHSIANLSSTTLQHFGVYNNSLYGNIPSGITNLVNLISFQISINQFSGTIPEELARNQLIGSIPPNISNLKVLSTFDVSDNNLSGEIPNQLSLCSSLEYLYIKGNFFEGFIPSPFSSLRGIRDIDLSHNNLSGQIPKFLETLSLENLNLSFNNFEGEVPSKGVFANASAISIVGNSNLLCGGIAELYLPKCVNNESKKEKISKLSKILIPIVSTFSSLVVMFFFIFCWLKKRRRKQPFEFESTLIRELLNLSYEKLLKATDGFSSTRLIGVGSFGSVYKGIFSQDGTIVAVKVLNLQRQGASKSFLAECKALRNIRHRNLVKVITSCSSIDFQGNDFKALVYEYMPNGSLEKWLHPTPKTEEEQPEIQNLTLLQRINIATDVASAIDYLHHHCHEPILHCDLKPGNVLLDDNMTAHVGDFGLARFLLEVSNPNKSSSVGVKGTIGYAAPEYGLGSELSTNGDVYSYGILLLEMVTRKKPIDPIFEGDFNLHNFARMALPDRVMDIVDHLLLNDEEEVLGTKHRLREKRNNIRKECFKIMVRIGVACSMESPQDRMNIRDVVNELKSAKSILLKLNRQEGL
ncbi:probable LRR receptor-like serine/threonine-protein kinase At3g47570 [Pistacia vera]|uniref:probable LRR receptor-like serine/threonine-protein kinase At3g47570 n=1 Tax=Pistacia vera TaxID=55513 RepID=UPI001262F5B8|nr:probable LRR receptor-like serine/threonine-protein kinase At3g47570 [Pistacia vera]